MTTAQSFLTPDAYDGEVTNLVLAIARGDLRDVHDIAERLGPMMREPER